MNPQDRTYEALSGRSGCEVAATAERPDESGQSDAVAALAGAVVRADVAAVLALHSPPQVTTNWAGGFFTCTYHSPTGRLVLSVREWRTVAAAAACFAALRRSLVAAWSPLRQAVPDASGCETSHGTVVMLSGCRVLVADATGLPPVCGHRMIARLDVAHRIADEVLGVWDHRSRREERRDVHA